MSPSVTKLAPAVMLLVGAVGLGGCATKSYVQEQIAPVTQRVAALETQLQQTDQTAKAALAEAQGHTQRLDQLNSRVDSAEQRILAQENRGRRPRH